MHYQSIRNVMRLIRADNITRMGSMYRNGDVKMRMEPSFYWIETNIGYTIAVSPYLCSFSIHYGNKHIGAVSGRCHHPYIKAFCEKVLIALKNGAVYDKWDKECFTEDMNDKPCKYV